MQKQPQRPWTAQEIQELYDVYAQYLSLLEQEEKLRPYNPEHFQKRSQLERQLFRHKALVLLTEDILSSVQRFQDKDSYAQRYALARLLGETIQKRHPIAEIELHRLRTVRESVEDINIFRMIAFQLQSSPKAIFKQEFYDTWTRAWAAYKESDPQDLSNQKHRFILCAFLSNFRRTSVIHDTEEILLEITDHVASSEHIEPFFGHIDIFRSAIIALEKANTPKTIEQLCLLYERLDSPTSPRTPDKDRSLELLRLLLARTYPLDQFARILRSLHDAPAHLVGDLVREGGVQAIQSWNKTLWTLYLRLQQTPIEPEEQESLFQALREATNDLAPALQRFLQQHLVVQEAAIRLLKTLALLGLYPKVELPTSLHSNFLQVAKLQLQSAQGMDLSEQDFIIPIASDDASIFNGAIYALAEQTSPPMRRFFLQQLQHPKFNAYQQNAAAFKWFFESIRRQSTHQTAPKAHDWLRAESDEDAILAILAYFAAKSFISDPFQGAFDPFQLLRCMTPSCWRTLQRLVATRAWPNQQANKVWTETFEASKETKNWACWILWAVALPPEADQLLGPKREDALDITLIEELLSPSMPSEEHRTKASWFLCFGTPSRVQSIQQCATSDQLERLDKHHARRIRGLLFRLDPTRLSRHQKALEEPLFS